MINMKNGYILNSLFFLLIFPLFSINGDKVKLINFKIELDTKKDIKELPILFSIKNESREIISLNRFEIKSIYFTCPDLKISLGSPTHATLTGTESLPEKSLMIKPDELYKVSMNYGYFIRFMLKDDLSIWYNIINSKSKCFISINLTHLVKKPYKRIYESNFTFSFN